MIPRGSCVALALIASSAASSVSDAQFVARILYQTTQDPGGRFHILDYPSFAQTTIDLSGESFNLADNPRWRPDGEEIVFAGRKSDESITQIWVIQPDGSGLARVTLGDGNYVMPSFAPDRRQIAYQSVYGTLRMINRDGTEAFDTGVPAGHVHWSPVGTKIAYTDWGYTYESDVYLYDIVRRTSFKLTTRTEVGEAYNFGVISPDGKRVAVQRKAGDHYDIVVLNVDGTGAINLTSDMPGSDEYFPAWTPDGDWLVFVSNAQGNNGNTDHWFMRADGTEKHNITNTPNIAETAPDVAPGFPCDADYNGDGFVNGDDYDYFVADFEEGC